MHTVTNNLSKCWNNHKIDCKAVIFVAALAIIFYGITYNVLPRDHSFRAALAQNWPVAVMIVAGMLFGRVEGSLAHRLNKNTHVQSSPSSLVEVRGESLLTPEREDLETNHMNDIRDMPKDPLKPLRVKPKTIDVPKEGERGVEEDLSIPLPQVEIPKKRNWGVVLDLITYVVLPIIAIGLGLGIKDIGAHWRLGASLYGGMILGRFQALFASRYIPKSIPQRRIIPGNLGDERAERAKTPAKSSKAQTAASIDVSQDTTDYSFLVEVLALSGVHLYGFAKDFEGDSVRGRVLDGKMKFDREVADIVLFIPKERMEQVRKLMPAVVEKAEAQKLLDAAKVGSGDNFMLYFRCGERRLNF